MTTLKKSFLLLLAAALLASLVTFVGCKQQSNSTSDSKQESGESRMFLASFALIDLTGEIGGTTIGTSKRYKENLNRILPVQKNTLDSAIFYSAAMELDSAMQLLSRIDRKSLSDSLAAVFYVLRANGDRVLNGDPERAMANIDSALAIDPRNPRALNAKSAILNDLGKFPEALAALDSAWALDSSNIKTRWYRAIIVARLGRAEEALASIEPDFQKTPDEHRYFLTNLKGWLLCVMNRCDEAIAYHDSALVLNPKHYFGYLDKAIAQYKLERYEEMIKTLDQADALVPNQVWVKYNKACCYAKLQNRDATLAALADAIKTEPSAGAHALEDPDFKAYHDDPEFRKLVGLE